MALTAPVRDPQTEPAIDVNALLTRVARGDRAAFSSLYAALAVFVIATIRRRLVDHDLSEEVAQEVFLEVWRTASTFDSSRGHAKAWITTMARRRAIDRIRSVQASRNRDLAIGIRDRIVIWDDVSEQYELRTRIDELRAAIDTLSPLQREAILLAYVHDYDSTEVAAELGVPLGTAKTRVHDGIRKLRQKLVAAA